MALDTSDPNAVRQAAQAIVSQAQFTSKHQSPWDRVIYYVTHPLDALDIAISWILSQFLGRSGGHTLVAALVAAAIAAIIIFMIVRFTRTTTRNRSVHVHYAPRPSGKSVKELLAEADTLEREQKWREAIRTRYTALIQQLGAQGIVRAQSGRTTGEYVSEVNRNAPGIADTFNRATRIFEWVWYGKGEPGREDAAEFKTLAHEANTKAAA